MWMCSSALGIRLRNPSVSAESRCSTKPKPLSLALATIPYVCRIDQGRVTGQVLPTNMNLAVKGLKTQVLGRVEELEAREREREELLAEVVPLLESRGYDTGALRAVMGG